MIATLLLLWTAGSVPLALGVGKAVGQTAGHQGPPLLTVVASVEAASGAQQDVSAAPTVPGRPRHLAAVPAGA